MDFQNLKIPIAVVVVIIAQAFGVIWYVATLDSTVGQLNSIVEEMRQKTAETSVAVLQSEVDNIKASISKLEDGTDVDLTPLTLRVSELESKVNNLESTGGDTYISGGGGGGYYYDDYPIWDEVSQVHMQIDDLNWRFEDMSYRFDVLMQVPYYDDSSLWYSIDDLTMRVNDFNNELNDVTWRLDDLSYRFDNQNQYDPITSYYDDSAIWYAIDDLWYGVDNSATDMDVHELSKTLYNIIDTNGAAWNHSFLKERIEILEYQISINWGD